MRAAENLGRFTHADTSTLHPHEQRRQETNHPNPEPTRCRDPDNTGTARLWLPIAPPPGAPRSRVGANQPENRYRVH